MAVTVTRTSALFTDNDGDGVADPGDTLLVHILIQNTNATDIVNLKVYDTQSGLTVDPNTVKITPIALDDFSPGAPLTIVGNTPYIVTASALLANDVDPDGPEASLTISGITNQNHVTVTDMGGGNYQIVPETGYQGVASFDYFITDAQGLTSVSSGHVNILISGQIWYVDSGYAGANGASDGSYLKPFTGLGSLNDDGTGAAGTVGPNDAIKGDDDVDGAGDSIFVYNRGTAYTGGITLEAGQKLYGDGHELTVNGFAIGVAGQTSGPTVNYSTYGVTLATDNTISGLNLNGTANGAVGIQDGNGSVTTAAGTLNIDTVAISGAGQAVDIDQGGNLNVALTSLSSTGTNLGPAVQLAGTASSGTALISGTFSGGTGSIAGEAGHGFQIGGQGPSSGGTVAVSYSGTIGSSSTGSAVNIADRLAGAGNVTFSGNITQTSTSTNTSAGIALSNIAGGTIDFTGTKTIAVNSGTQSAIQVSSQSGGTINFGTGAIDIDFATGTTGSAFSISSQSGGSVNVSTAADIDMVGTGSGRGINIGSSTAGSVNFTGGSLTISTRDGAALFDSNSAGSTHALNISGSGNTLSTTNGGQLVEISNASTSGITFNTLTTGATVAGTAVRVNNLDGGSFNTSTITVTGTAGAGADGVRIEGGSTAVFNLGTVGTSNTSDDGVEINGAGNGAVTIDSISVQNALGQGVEINGATAAVTITAGGIGNTNDPTQQGVLITGGNGNVTIGATVAKTTSGNVVDVNNHTGGTIAFGGTVSATASGGGVSLVSNTGSTINFTNTLTLTTSSTGTVAFNATGGGTVSASAANSTINSGAGVGLNVVNTSIGAADLNFQSVTVNGAANGIVLNNTGSAGGLTITGTGTTDGTGGTIQNTTGRGIDIQNAVQIKLSNMTLTNAGTTDLDNTNGGLSTGDNLQTNAAINLVNVTNVTLTNVDITGGAEQGINGNNVANFNLINSSITNVGNEADEDNIHFYNMSGTSSIVNTVLTHTSGGGDDNLNLQMQSGNLDLTITGGSATGTNVLASNQGSGYLFGIRGTATANINIDGASVTNHFSGGVVADAFDTATMNLRVNNSTLQGNNDQLSVSAGDSSKVDLEATNNTIGAIQSEDKIGIGLLGSAFDTGYVFDARISGNTITIASGVTGDGVIVNNAGGGQINFAMTSNTINYSGTQRAVLVQTGQDGNGTMNATIQSNTIDMKNPGALANPAFLIQSAVTGPGNTSSINLNMGGAGALANTFLHSGGGTIAAGDIRVRQRFDGTINLDGYVGGGQDTTAIVNYLNGRNNEISSSTATVDGTTPHNYTGNATPTFITVSVSAASVAEDGANLIFTFTRDGSAASSLVANFTITGTATAGSDFVVSGGTFNNATGIGTVTFAAGSSTATITVDPSSDAIAETDESVVVDAGNSATHNGGFARAMISNDDGALFMQMAAGPQDGNASAPAAQATATQAPVQQPANDSPLQAAGGYAPSVQPTGSHVHRFQAITHDALDQAGIDWGAARFGGRNPAPAATPPAPAGNAAPPAAAGPVTPPAVAGDSAPPATVVNDDGRISQAELDLMVAAAIDRWAAAGASAEQVAAMRSVKVSISEMMGLQIGGASSGLIQIDNDAAGYGWFVDATPGDDSEYAGSGTRLTADSGPAANRVDLLTVLMHELGHQIGLDDDYSSAGGVDAMYGYMDVGERRLPASGDAARASGHAPVNEAFILAPVADIGTLPAGKAVDIQFQGVIDTYFNQVISQLSNTSTATGDNISDTNSNTNVTTIDTLTLGDRVYIDANNNGIFDAGEGKNGVTLTLFADTNNNGVLDIGTDVQLLTTTTAGIGAATGSYSFANLSPGNYIVRVDASNFAGGGALAGTRGVFGALDPDNNTDNDDNGAAGPGGSTVASPISLAYNSEPTSDGGAIPKNDVNNTLDFGFVVNTAPVANADSLTATEDTPAQYSTELTGNDTDADLDTLTVTAVSNFVNGTASVAGGVVTFTPNANFNGTASFDYTISDGNGHTATATATVTVGAVNDPVTTAAPGTASLNEDAANVAIAGLAISDADSALAPSGIYVVTLSATQGKLTMTTLAGLTFSAGDGTADTTMTFSGTLSAINTALATASYTPNLNYNGSASITLQATDTDGVSVATGSGAATSDSDVVAVTVNSVNDAPVGANQNSAATEGVEYVFSATDFSENFSDPVEGNSFAGIRIISLPTTGTLELGGLTITTVPTDVTLTQLTNGDLTYVPAAGSAGTSPTFQFRVQDNGGTANGGQDFAINDNVYTINITSANAAPVLDLDASGAGTGFSAAYTEGGAAAAISDTDVLITDSDAGDMIEGATITIANAVAGDVLNAVGSLPGSIAVDLVNSTPTTLILTGTGTQAQYEAAIEQITFSSSSNNPTAGGNTSRTINVTVTDGSASSNTAVTTISVADDNADAPAGTSSTITAIEDTFRLIAAADLGFSDVDGTLASVTITAVTGGAIYTDADGSAGAGGFVLETLPKTYSAQDLIDGKVAFLAAPNANGAGIGTITFAVTDDDGNTDASPNTLTVDVTPVNDSPDIDGVATPVGAIEQTAAAILAGKGVSDVDLDARNGGNGDYAGSSFSIARNLGANAEDVFSILPGANFTVDGNDLKSGGQIFATVTTNSGGQLVIAFTSLQAIATSALVDEVIASVNYTNSSDAPPSSVSLAYSFNDGAPGGGQGTGASATDNEMVSVAITAINDAPSATVSDVNATEQVPVSLKGAISVADVDAGTGLVSVDVTVASGGVINSDPGTSGVTITTVSGGVRVKGTLAQLNDFFTTNATSVLTFTSSSDSPPVSVTLNVSVNDNNSTGSAVQPGLVTNASSTIFIAAVDDAPIAVPDSVTTPEDTVGTTGNLLTNDSDPDGDPVTISGVTGGTLGVPFALPSGAILTVNSDGTYSYNPNGKFNTLTNPSGGEVGAVNTSAIDTFEYTVSGGNTVTVTVTVTGVANSFDWLAGNSSDNTISGTPNGDFFFVVQGGNDHLSGLGGDDIFFFGGAMTSGDDVNGGAGTDQIALQGDYSGGLTLGTGVVSVESIGLLPGSDTRFGAPGTQFYDYDITTVNENVAAGQQLVVDGARLRVGEDLTFDGSAETDGSFFIYGGKGQDDLTGGTQNDVFLFGPGRWGSGDTVDGGGGQDQLALRGDYTIVFGATQIVDIVSLGLLSAYDTRYGALGERYDYNLTMNDGNVAAGVQLTVDGAKLGADETLVFNGSAETDGTFRVFGGKGDDVITGGKGDDIITGGLGHDKMTGGLGNDTFRFVSTADSPANRDEILDFTSGDKIDLSKIDADTTAGAAGNQAFTFIDSQAFHGVAGELRFELSSGNVWLVQGDTDGNGVSDFEFLVTVTDASPITSSDFML
ncbi:MAG TPA: Ig-like domain-containing protein [Allosphingosinicella sp.]|jgi:hypothetical protein